MVEYIGLEPSEQIYAKKNLLYCEMELLNTLKQYQNYKKLRKDVLSLKSLLRRTIIELQDEVKKFDNLLPEIKRDKFKPFKISTQQKKRRDLEEEINEIKRQITELST